MRKQFFNINILFSIFLVIFSLSILIRGYQEVGDTGAYLNFYYNRPILIPIVFNITKLIFGNLWPYVIVLFNVLIIDFFLFCFYIFCKENFYDFLLSVNFYFVLILLLIPYYSSNIGNNLSSEGFSYPLCLFLYLHIFKSLISNKSKHFFIVYTLFLFLFLSRKQFIFLIPGLLIYSIYFCLKLKNLKLYKSLIFVIIIFVTASLLERFYNYVLHSEFTENRGEVYLITPAMFIASAKDSNLFYEEIKKDFVASVINELLQKKLNYDFKNEYKINVGELYAINVEPMFYGIIQANLNRKFNYLSEDHSHFDFSKLDLVKDFTKEVSFKIITKNLDRFFDFYYKNVQNWFGGKLYFYFFLIFLIFYFVLFLKQNNLDFFFILLITVFHFSNILLLALFANFEIRYLLYTIFPMFVTMLFQWVIFKRNNK